MQNRLDVALRTGKIARFNFLLGLVKQVRHCAPASASVIVAAVKMAIQIAEAFRGFIS